VIEDTAAEEAGLQEGDVILEYSGIPVLSTSQFSRLVRETPVGRNVDLTISRNGATQTIRAKLAKGKGPMIWQHEGNRLEVLPREGGRAFRFYSPEERSFDFAWPEAFVAPGRPRLGVSIQSLTEQMAEFLGVEGKEGVLVTSITKGSAADGKLKAGDVITQADGKMVADVAELQRILRGKKDGDNIDLRVVRDKGEITISVNFGKKKPGYVM
jgi:serine protease Do